MEENALEAFPSEREPHRVSEDRSRALAVEVPRIGRLVTAPVDSAAAARARSGVTMRIPRLSWGLRLGIVGILLAGAAGVATIGVLADGEPSIDVSVLLSSR